MKKDQVDRLALAWPNAKQPNKKQRQVTKDDLIVAEKVKGAEVGTTLEMKEVLLVGTPEDTIVGRPLVPGAMVKLFVEQQTKDKKVTILLVLLCFVVLSRAKATAGGCFYMLHCSVL